MLNCYCSPFTYGSLQRTEPFASIHSCSGPRTAKVLYTRPEFNTARTRLRHLRNVVLGPGLARRLAPQRAR
jgi:hypothetical protein